jgi:EAL domain-containing protein (putative c-di-GMP-specific phosphodiesterase class I)
MTNDPFGNRLLVVDDDPALGRVVKRVGESVGFDVIVTEDPAVFLRTARQWQASVIMLDLNIPGMDGIELLRALAAEKCAAPVLVTSGADPRVLDAAQQLGRERGLKMGEPIQKPFGLQALREVLRKYQPVPRTLLALDLASAIAAEQLILEYQPKLDCRVGRITGVEALVRWAHPVRGIVPPDEFVPLAEESDLIRDLTNWVVARAAKQAAEWRSENLTLEVAVNISAKDVQDIELPERLHQHCFDAGVDPTSIVLEVTETGTMREPVQMMDVLTRLRLKGFNLSIDDFGTGYSSLVQLQKMPFSEVKIDRSFVMRMMNNNSCKVIVEIIIDLARKLGLKTVAEGVEEKAALDYLMLLGCDMAQGYHLSPPISAEHIADFVRQCDHNSTKSAA